MESKAINQEVDDPGLPRSGHVHHLFQKGLALNPPLCVLSRVGKRTASIIQTHSNTTTLGAGMVLTLPENSILHGPERHGFEVHPHRGITDVLLHRGEIPEDHNIVELVHRETPVTEKVDHQVVVLLGEVPFWPVRKFCVKGDKL